MWDSKSDTSIPLSPYFLNPNGEAINLDPTPDRGMLGTFAPILSGTYSPSIADNWGLGSNVSMCPGPPDMNKKITFLTEGGKCGCCEPLPP